MDESRNLADQYRNSSKWRIIGIWLDLKKQRNPGIGFFRTTAFLGLLRRFIFFFFSCIHYSAEMVAICSYLQASPLPSQTSSFPAVSVSPRFHSPVAASNFNNRIQVQPTTAFAVSRRDAFTTILSGFIASQFSLDAIAATQPNIVFREYIDTFDGYSFKYPKNWIQVKGAGADIFFRDPYILDENLSVDISSPSSSNYKSVEDLGSPQEAADRVLKQYLTEFMSTRIGVRRESKVVATDSRVADDGRKYYQVEVNIKSYANNNELAVMPQDRVVRMEWDRRYLAVLGVENNRLYGLRLQVPESVLKEEEDDIRRIMDSFRVNIITV